jgi:hypothetical protein
MVGLWWVVIIEVLTCSVSVRVTSRLNMVTFVFCGRRGFSISAGTDTVELIWYRLTVGILRQHTRRWTLWKYTSICFTFDCAGFYDWGGFNICQGINVVAIWSVLRWMILICNMTVSERRLRAVGANGRLYAIRVWCCNSSIYHWLICPLLISVLLYFGYGK